MAKAVIVFMILAGVMLGLSAAVNRPPVGYAVDKPSITIAAGTATTTGTATAFAHEAHVLWTFGTVSGTYSTCTVQASTSHDAVNFFNLGSAQTVTVTSNTKNAWDIYQLAPTTTVTTGTPSATTVTGFAQLTRFVFACSSYGTSAPVSITAIYR